MKKNGIMILLIGVFILVTAVFAGRKPSEKSPEVPETTAATESGETVSPLPEAVLYYGEITEIQKDDQGNPRTLWMDSQRDGAWGMNLGAPTVYVDSGERKAFDPAFLEVGQRVYVFHSPIAARTLPPQSPAFAILRNIPMDASCGMYHRAEKLEPQEDGLLIRVQNGDRTLKLDGTSELLSYEGEKIPVSSLQEGDRIIAWYWDRGEEILRASHVMVLPGEE